jgi:hypothetical protein
MIILFKFAILVFISLIFFTSALDKAKNKMKTISEINNYGVNTRIARIVYYLIVPCEFYISFSLIRADINLLNFIILSLLLTIFSIAVLYQLVKGNKNIPCGCGGVLKSNKLSINIVIRNILIIIIYYLIYQHSHDFYLNIFQATLIIGSIISLFLLNYTVIEMKEVKELRVKILSYF